MVLALSLLLLPLSLPMDVRPFLTAEVYTSSPHVPWIAPCLPQCVCVCVCVCVLQDPDLPLIAEQAHSALSALRRQEPSRPCGHGLYDRGHHRLQRSESARRGLLRSAVPVAHSAYDPHIPSATILSQPPARSRRGSSSRRRSPRLWRARREQRQSPWLPPVDPKLAIV